MTLVLTRASQRYILQVTDRLVTRARAAFDKLANKNIVYHARNAIVTMGYSGHAFIGDVPTDQWIAERLIGEPLDRSRKPPAIQIGKILDPWLDIGQSLLLLKNNLDEAVNTDIEKQWKDSWVAQSFDLIVAGYQWNKKGRIRPILSWLGKARDSRTFELVNEPRDWYYGKRFRVGMIPSENLSSTTLQSLTDELSDKPIDKTQDLLVETIRQVSNRLPEVGPDCISILLTPPNVGQVHIRYLPTSPAIAVVANEKKKTSYKLRVAFSPWIIGPSICTAPSIMSDQSEVDLGIYKVYLHAPDNPRTLGILSSQVRPKPPH